MIVGGATPKSGPLTIDGVDQTGTLSWLDRREAVLVNLGTDGTVEAAGETYAMGPMRHAVSWDGHGGCHGQWA